MEYTITQIVEVSEAKFGKRVKFKVEGSDDVLTAFSKYPMNIGDKITGYIEESKYGKDFKFGRKETASQSSDFGARTFNMLQLEVMPALKSIIAWQEKHDIGKAGKVELPNSDPDAIDDAFNSSPF